MSGDLNFYLIIAGFIVVALLLIWLNHKVTSRIIDKAFIQIAYFGKPKPIEYYELGVFLCALTVPMLLSSIEIYPLPFSIGASSFEIDFITTTRQCGFGEVAEEKVNAWRNGIVFSIVGLIVILFRIKSYFAECRRRMALAPELRAGILMPIIIGGVCYFYYTRIIAYFNPADICAGEHSKFENILYASAAPNFAVLIVFLVILLFAVQISLKFR